MRIPAAGGAVLAVVCSLPACSWDPVLDLSGPTSIPTMPCLEASEWRIGGFSPEDLGPGQEVLLPLGHSRELLVSPIGFAVDCDQVVASVRWVSTRPDVAEVFAPDTASRWAWLTGRALGTASVSAHVALTDGRTVVAGVIVGGSARSVRVAPTKPPPGARRVLLEGTVELEPENPTATPSTRAYLAFEVPAVGVVDLFVDWDSVSNDVITHLCPGRASFPTGCVPIIDGNRFKGSKPMTASTETTPGIHTLWISNNGPGAERVQYQVGFLPG